MKDLRRFIKTTIQEILDKGVGNNKNLYHTSNESYNNIKKFNIQLGENVDMSDKNHGLLLRSNKKFWIGSVNILDGRIEEVHTYEKAFANDFHHSLYFSQTQVEKIKNEECMIFWVDLAGVQGEWRHGKLPWNIAQEINKQIEIV